MKGGHILAAAVAILVGLFASAIISWVLLLPAIQMLPGNVLNPVMRVVGIIIFGVIFVVVFREMSEKFAK